MKFEGSVACGVNLSLLNLVVFLTPFAVILFPVSVVASALGEDFDRIVFFYLLILPCSFLFSSDLLSRHTSIIMVLVVVRFVGCEFG